MFNMKNYEHLFLNISTNAFNVKNVSSAFHYSGTKKAFTHLFKLINTVTMFWMKVFANISLLMQPDCFNFKSLKMHLTDNTCDQAITVFQ